MPTFPRWYWIVLVCSLALPALVNVVFKWIVAPIRLHGGRGHRATANFRTTHADELTPELRDFLSVVVRQFVAEGYEARANVSEDTEVTEGGRTRSTQVLLVHPATNDVATAFGVLAGTSRALVMAVQSEFADGTSVATGSNRSPGVFPRNRKVDSVNFAWVTDARALCEAHRRRMAALGFTDRPRVAPAPGGEVEYLEREREREMRRVVDHGDYWFDAAADAYRLTWKGAFLHAWKLTDPVKTWRVRLRDRRGRRVWRRLGMDQWRPAAAAETAHSETVSHPIAAGPAGAAAPAPGELRYEAALADGEIREEHAGGVLTVRAGMPTVAQFLARQWGSLAWLAFLLVTAVVWVRVFWMAYRMRLNPLWRGMLPPFLLPRAVWIYFTLTVGFFLWEAYKLFRGILFASRGNVILTASLDGLAYRNAPAWRGSGHVPRAEIDVLPVALHALGFRGKRFRLEVRTLSPRRSLPLVFSKDLAALQRLADTLGAAMGINPPPAAQDETALPPSPGTPGEGRGEGSLP